MSRLMECPWTGKKIYWNQRAAQKEQVRHAKHGLNMRLYKCNKCTYFHLATIKKKREKPDESLPD